MSDVVFVGGGHSHAIALKMWGMQPQAKARLTLISDVTYTPYSGMLPGYVAGFYGYEETHIDLRRLAHFAQADFLKDQVIGLDLDQKVVHCTNRPPVRFDYLSLDIGSTPATETIPGVKAYAIAAKPVPQFLDAWQRILDTANQAPDQPQRIIIVGGGAGGTELAFNIHHALSQRLASPELLELHLVHRGQQLMGTNQNPGVSRQAQKLLQHRNVQVHLQETVVEVTPTGVRCQSGLVLTGKVIWVTQAAAPSWLRASGLQTDNRGFVLVNQTLRSPSHPFVFAAGDIATMRDEPRPKAGVFAVRQGKPLLRNLQRVILGKTLEAYHPQKRYLALIGTGDKQAFATWGKLSWRSPLLWRWKDHIDRKFMAQFADLPQMSQTSEFPAQEQPKMYCAGCGAKVGKDILASSLKGLNLPTHADVIVGLDQPDDAAIIQIPRDQLLVQTIDYFPSLINDPFLLGQIVTHHCLSDLYSMGATPHSVLVLATLSHGKARVQQGILQQLLAGVVEILNRDNIALIGGHTNEADQLGLGLTCNGLLQKDAIWRKTELKQGQVLILTKPLGTGTLFAAEMQGKTKGHWIDGVIASMEQSNKTAAEILRKYGATACTDVTGFGLAGHLLEMLQPSGLGAEIHLDQLPILEGARETLQRGLTSSLAPQNHTAEQFIQVTPAQRQRPDYELLFDPQTSGGLLAAIAPENAHTCLKTLQSGGHPQSAIIGRIVKSPASQAQISIS
ncbi:selenide, water dikinase SelD [Picosynechococcus sp. PCC 11901]|uniref:selenide, water dikinase SelD n=1 Tax=Picosynechococcus sp. PCC 11901 TaxID=2579791 RepID=UPI0010FC3183|nr:selenide, water dikinase SelD [Picosynechococcus sp. PCC 11901]QCS48554.1 selenide, water dikinase SelD [Picosynechococcus sp. PCC 11901]